MRQVSRPNQWIRVPRLNANDDQLLITDILVRVGQRVEVGDSVAIVESSKATSPVESPAAGIVSRVLAEVGARLDVGEALVELALLPTTESNAHEASEYVGDYNEVIPHEPEAEAEAEPQWIDALRRKALLTTASHVDHEGGWVIEADRIFLGENVQLARGVHLKAHTVVLADGVVYVGTDTGQVYALPWHLGKYDWAAERLERTHRSYEAGVFYAVVAHSTHSINDRENLYRKAETRWDAIGESEWAARMWEGLAHEKRAADAYCRAAESHRGRDNRQAAEYYYSASRLYWRLDDMAAQADQSAKQAAKLGRWPDIRLKVRNNPRMTQGKTGMISFRAENIGYGPARNLFFSLGGSLIQPVDCKVATPLLPDSYFDISLEIVPTKSTDSLRVEAEYGSDEIRKIPFSSQLSMTIEAGAPPHKIKAGDSVMGKLKIVNPNNEPVEIEIGDRVGTEVEIVLGEDALSESSNPHQAGFARTICPKCHASLPPEAKHCTKCGRKL